MNGKRERWNGSDDRSQYRWRDSEVATQALNAELQDKGFC